MWASAVCARNVITSSCVFTTALPTTHTRTLGSFVNGASRVSRNSDGVLLPMAIDALLLTLGTWAVVGYFTVEAMLRQTKRRGK